MKAKTRTTKANNSTSIIRNKFEMQHDYTCQVELTRAHAHTWGQDVIQVFFKNNDDGSEKVTFFELDEFKEFAVMVAQFLQEFKDIPENEFD